jgi:hypothetical protein
MAAKRTGRRRRLPTVWRVPESPATTARYDRRGERVVRQADSVSRPCHRCTVCSGTWRRAAWHTDGAAGESDVARRCGALLSAHSPLSRLMPISMPGSWIPVQCGRRLRLGKSGHDVRLPPGVPAASTRPLVVSPVPAASSFLQAHKLLLTQGENAADYERVILRPVST